MTTVVLLDPAIVLDASDEPALELLLDWTSDARVRLGIRAWARIAEDYGANALLLPAALMRLAHRGISELLSRPPLESVEGDTSKSLSAPYSGQPTTHKLLLQDVVGLGEVDERLALGTHESLWGGPISSISCVPPPPSDLRVHLQPNLPTPAELRQRAAEYFEHRRILIVGGQIDGDIVRALGHELGIQEDLVRWIPSEKNKRARNLKDVIGGLPADAIVVCIVGKVGHDVSGEVKDNTQRRAVLLCESRFSSQIVDDLRRFIPRR